MYKFNFLHEYYGIIVRGGPMFVAFVGNPCTQIYISLNVIYTSLCLVFIYKIELATEEITSLQTRKMLATHEHWPNK